MSILFTNLHEGLWKMLRVKAVSREKGLKEYCRSHGLFEDYNTFFMSLKEQHDAARNISISVNPRVVSKDREYLLEYIHIPKKHHVPKMTIAKFVRENPISNFADDPKNNTKTLLQLKQITGSFNDTYHKSTPSNGYPSYRSYNSLNFPKVSERKIKDHGTSIMEEYGLTADQSGSITTKKDITDAVLYEPILAKKKPMGIGSFDLSLNLTNNFEKIVDSETFVQDGRSDLYEKLRAALFGPASSKRGQNPQDISVNNVKKLSINTQTGLPSAMRKHRKLSEKSIILRPNEKKRLASWDSILMNPSQKEIKLSSPPHSLTYRESKRNKNSGL